MKFLKCFRNFFKKDKNWYYIIAPSFLAIICLLIHFSLEPEKQIKDNTIVLIPVDSLSKAVNDVKTHNYNLISMLNERKKPEEDNLGQLRTNYFLIIAVILSLILSSNSEKRKRLPMFVILLSIIALMYSLDIQLQDQNNRNSRYYGTILGNVEKVINSDSVNTFWYKFDTDNMRTQLVKSAKFSVRMKRKFLKVFHPDGEQIVYFVIPWIFVYYFSVFEFYRNKP
jgi:hypothetical protein